MQVATLTQLASQGARLGLVLLEERAKGTHHHARAATCALLLRAR
jgi:hypothetical protein